MITPKTKNSRNSLIAFFKGKSDAAVYQLERTRVEDTFSIPTLENIFPNPFSKSSVVSQQLNKASQI